MGLSLEKETKTKTYRHAESETSYEVAPMTSPAFIKLRQRHTKNGVLDLIEYTKEMSKKIVRWQGVDAELNEESREKFALKFMVEIMPGIIDTSIEAGTAAKEELAEAKKD